MTGVTSKASDVVTLVPIPMTGSEPEWSTKLAQNVHLFGNNFRFSAGGTYNSTTVVSISNEQLLVHLRAKARSITDVVERNEIATRLNRLQKAQVCSRFSLFPVEPAFLVR